MKMIRFRALGRVTGGKVLLLVEKLTCDKVVVQGFITIIIRRSVYVWAICHSMSEGRLVTCCVFTSQQSTLIILALIAHLWHILILALLPAVEEAHVKV